MRAWVGMRVAVWEGGTGADGGGDGGGAREGRKGVGGRRGDG